MADDGDDDAADNHDGHKDGGEGTGIKDAASQDVSDGACDGESLPVINGNGVIDQAVGYV